MLCEDAVLCDVAVLDVDKLDCDDRLVCVDEVMLLVDEAADDRLLELDTVSSCRPRTYMSYVTEPPAAPKVNRWLAPSIISKAFSASW